MSDQQTDTGSNVPPLPEGAYAPTPSSQQTPPDGDNTPGTGETAQKDEQVSSFPKEEAAKLQGSNTELHPLEGDPVGKAEKFEEQRKSDLDAEREEHLRRRSGGEAQE